MNPPETPPEVLTQLRISDQRVAEIKAAMLNRQAEVLSAAEVVALCDDLARARRRLRPIVDAARRVLFLVNGDRQLVMKAPAEALARLILAGLEALDMAEPEVEEARGRGKPS